MASVLFSPLVMTGCAPRAYRVYDPYYHDYHRWNDHETFFYQRWEGETQRDHRDFRQRRAEEQTQYWSWRHTRPD
jgi:hypothetical protein